MSKWKGKSDFEINKAVADARKLNWYVSAIDSDNVVVLYGCEVFDPCNEANDAWPIIVNTCMTIELAHPELGQVGTNIIYNPHGTDWQCDYTDNKDCFRAAMIVYLEMKENE